MNIALIGATGNVGTRILAELRRRGHTVTAIVRNAAKVPAQEGVTAKAGDIGDAAGLAPLLAGHDAVISSIPFSGLDLTSLVTAVKTAAVKRLLIVGGAGSLEVAPGVALIDTPEFPAAYKAEASAGRDVLNALRQGIAQEGGVEWTFLSPSAYIFPGERTGQFRLADDQLLVDAEGKSHISYEDFAVALVDEVESPAHANRRFTVGY
ncbi:NAD(P)-dependent oxidoreductase [Nitrospirillum sp. BR 11828]|uniref:NAD(P)-dependent oxidoreductase n=1 Tax=Nitrospirillum sp. BR 11828 TaxID=3104325 RepID=UPI002ACA5F6A|nr:NAD(P)-dependent oxidoreductase [Nitrospirillum sp. BR 11828]MDZ5649120.1 NAD(P)-dependent oxidoreductase [Nitrospirillum sp. BR 11828]